MYILNPFHLDQHIVGAQILDEYVSFPIPILRRDQVFSFLHSQGVIQVTWGN